jgi:hypothetical protein
VISLSARHPRFDPFGIYRLVTDREQLLDKR